MNPLVETPLSCVSQILEYNACERYPLMLHQLSYNNVHSYMYIRVASPSMQSSWFSRLSTPEAYAGKNIRPLFLQRWVNNCSSLFVPLSVLSPLRPNLSYATIPISDKHPLTCTYIARCKPRTLKQCPSRFGTRGMRRRVIKLVPFFFLPYDSNLIIHSLLEKSICCKKWQLLSS